MNLVCRSVLLTTAVIEATLPDFLGTILVFGKGETHSSDPPPSSPPEVRQSASFRDIQRKAELIDLPPKRLAVLFENLPRTHANLLKKTGFLQTLHQTCVNEIVRIRGFRFRVGTLL